MPHSPPSPARRSTSPPTTARRPATGSGRHGDRRPAGGV